MPPAPDCCTLKYTCFICDTRASSSLSLLRLLAYSLSSTSTKGRDRFSSACSREED